MPLYNKEKIYGVQVPMKGGTTQTCIYGSKQDMTGLSADLGITAFTVPSAIPASGVFTGANSPKPPIGSKIVGTKRKSSYCTAATASTKADVTVKYPKIRTRAVHTIDDIALVVSVYVEVEGIKRAWNMPKTQYNLIQTDFVELGIEACKDNEALDYVWGCEAPYPAKVKKKNPTGTEGGDVYITFCAETSENNLANWVRVANRVSVARYFGAEDLASVAP